MRALLLILLLISNALTQTPECDPTQPASVVFKEPFTSVKDAASRFSCVLQYWVKTSDYRAHFLIIYIDITRNIQQALDTGYFVNTEWMHNYTTTFTNYYRAAVYNWELGNTENVTNSWQIAFQHAEKKDLLIVQNAILGINAHILHDLALAINDVDPHDNTIDDNNDSIASRDHDSVVGSYRGSCGSKFHDSTLVDDVLIPSYQIVESALLKFYAPVFNLLYFDVFIDWVSVTGISLERAKAFWVAVMLSDSGPIGAAVIQEYLKDSSYVTAVVITGVPQLLFGIYDDLKKLEGIDSVKTMCETVPLPCK